MEEEVGDTVWGPAGQGVVNNKTKLLSSWLLFYSQCTKENIWRSRHQCS